MNFMPHCGGALCIHALHNAVELTAMLFTQGEMVYFMLSITVQNLFWIPIFAGMTEKGFNRPSLPATVGKKLYIVTSSSRRRPGSISL